MLPQASLRREVDEARRAQTPPLMLRTETAATVNASPPPAAGGSRTEMHSPISPARDVRVGALVIPAAVRALLTAWEWWEVA